MTSNIQHHIAFLDRGTIGPTVQINRPNFEHSWVEYQQTKPAEVVERLQGKTIAVINKVPMRKAELQQLDQLKFIAVAATGTDVVDKAFCAQKGILVSNVRNYAQQTVPEHTFGFILALRRNIVAYHRAVQNGEWQKAAQFCFFTYPILALHKSQLGIIGDGSLGGAVAKLATAFGMDVCFAGHAEQKADTKDGHRYMSLDELVKTSDVISLHCPLTEKTQNIIGKKELNNMKPHCLLINTARGGLVDEPALVDAIRAGQIGGAGFDVVKTEPPEPGHPFETLMNHPNFLLTPHVAWSGQEAQQVLWNQVVEHIENFYQGNPSNLC